MSCRIITVEDDLDIAHVLQVNLRMRGCKLVAAFTTVEHAKKSKLWEETDSAIIDYNLPHAHGTELVRWLRKNHPHVRTVLVTALPPSALPKDAGDMADAVLHKPYDTETLFRLAHVPGHDDA